MEKIGILKDFINAIIAANNQNALGCDKSVILVLYAPRLS